MRAGAGDFYSRSEVNVADALNLAEKQAIVEKEQRLITALNRVLAQLGYEVVATMATTPAARRADDVVASQAGRERVHLGHRRRRLTYESIPYSNVQISLDASFAFVACGVQRLLRRWGLTTGAVGCRIKRAESGEAMM